MNRKVPQLSEDEKSFLSEYLLQILLRPGSTEYAVFSIFEPGKYATNPLEQENKLGNPDFSVPISFFYGDKDWTDKNAGKRIIEKNQFKD